jgi:hypothetical protein
MMVEKGGDMAATTVLPIVTEIAAECFGAEIEVGSGAKMGYVSL